MGYPRKAKAETLWQLTAPPLTHNAGGPANVDRTTRKGTHARTELPDENLHAENPVWPMPVESCVLNTFQAALKVSTSEHRSDYADNHLPPPMSSPAAYVNTVNELGSERMTRTCAGLDGKNLVDEGPGFPDLEMGIGVAHGRAHSPMHSSCRLGPQRLR